MAGTLTVAEIAIRVKRQFGDESGSQINDDDIFRWVNDVQRDIAQANDLLQSRARTGLFRGQREYALPPDVLTLRSVRYGDVKLRPISPQEAEELIDKPHDVDASTPQIFWLWANKINLYPTPSVADPDDLQVFYTRQPFSVAALSDVPELPGQYHNRIVEYCLAQAYELDENWSAAQIKQQQYDKGVSSMRGDAQFNPQDFYPSITSLPGDY